MSGSQTDQILTPYSVPAAQPVELAMSPVEVVEGLRHLPGVVFFDTSGNLPSRCHAPVSIIAARPVNVVRGGIEDIEELRHEIGRWQVHSPSLGFPVGGACGWVDYEGGILLWHLP